MMERSVIWGDSVLPKDEGYLEEDSVITWLFQRLGLVLMCCFCHLILQHRFRLRTSAHGLGKLPVHGICQRMGACLCKDRSSQAEVTPPNNHVVETAGPRTQGVSPAQAPPSNSGELRQTDPPVSPDRRNLVDLYTSKINSLVLETLSLIRTLVDNEQEPPQAMLLLYKIADKEQGWLAVVRSLVKAIPMENPLGPAVITMLLDECPLPTREAILKFAKNEKLSKATSISGRNDPTIHRNICVILGCLAEKLAGPNSIALLSEDVLDYLVANLTKECHPVVILHSIVALEKFSQTSENKVTISKRLEKSGGNRLLDLEGWLEDEDYIRREVGFCAQWCLDNLFVCEGRPYSYESANVENLNVMLNTKDVSEYLKISPDGLEARCDALSFESVRCTFQVDTGVWYYEVTIITPGVMQIGWATNACAFLNYEGYGIGDDEFSIAYDGCRQLIWHNAHSEPHLHPCWKAGDTLGLLLDVDNQQLIFYLNGQGLEPHHQLFKRAGSGFFAAASFMSYQQCQFNFGAKPFRYPPPVQFNKFNDFGQLTREEKVVMPRHNLLALLRRMSVTEDSCTLCFDHKATVMLNPCGHRGFCVSCSYQLETCPMCRELIRERVISNDDDVLVTDGDSDTTDIDMPDHSGAIKSDHVILSMTDPATSSCTNNAVATVS